MLTVLKHQSLDHPQRGRVGLPTLRLVKGLNETRITRLAQRQVSDAKRSAGFLATIICTLFDIPFQPNRAPLSYVREKRDSRHSYHIIHLPIIHPYVPSPKGKVQSSLLFAKPSPADARSTVSGPSSMQILGLAVPALPHARSHHNRKEMDKHFHSEFF